MADQTHVLFVEDDDVIREATQLALERDGFAVTAMPDGLSGLAAFRANRPDIALLDVMVPGLDGVSLCRRYRDESTVPVMMLSARADSIDVVLGLQAGADDYVTKPFSLEEVVARIRAILRRTQQQVEDDPIIRVGDREINEDSHDVSRAGQPIDLSPTEYKLLRYLMDNEGRVLSKAQILDHVWQYDWGGDAAIVESYISYLRKKVDGIVIEDENGDKHKVTPLIETKRGIGYMIRAPKN